jgi:putative ABC transport system permease protein
MLSDVRFALRLFLRTPGPVALCVLALALGIGANTALFSVVQTVLLKPLNYQEPDQIMVLAEKAVRASTPGESVSPANFLDWRREAKSFSAMGAAVAWSAALTGSGEPEELPGLQVSGDLFQLLGAQPLLGRGFTPGDESGTATPSAVLSYGLWQRRFGGDKSVIGRPIILSGQPYVIAGVMPPDFRFAPYWATRSQLWVNLRFDPTYSAMRRARMLRVFGRLAPGVTPQQAAAEMTALGARLSAAHPIDNAETTISVTPLREKVVGRVRLALIVLMSAAGLVLLIACASAAHLLLARAVARQQEIAVRLALGASRAQIIRQLVTESLLLSLSGALAGVAFASFAVQALSTALRQAEDFNLLPRFEEIGIDAGVLAFTAAISVLTGVLFGLAPAWFGARTGVSPLQSRGEVAKGAGRSWTVTAQVALAQILLIGALLLVRSFWNLQQLDPGFTPAQVIAANVLVKGSRETATPLVVRMVESAANLPGVQSASATNHIPLAGDVWTLSITLEGKPTPPPGPQTPSAVYRLSLPRYFETIGSPLRRGRDFTWADRAGAPAVAIVNETMARRYWPGEDALGKRFRVGVLPTDAPVWVTIVGISRDLKQGAWAEPTSPEMHLSALQPTSVGANAGTSMTLVVRTPIDAASLMPALRSAVWKIDGTVPLSNETTMARAVSRSTWRQRLNTVMLGSFAALALILALIGVYGVVSFAVTERRPEIGLRMALGAGSWQVARLVILAATRLVALGLVVGWAASWMLATWLEGMLFEVKAHDLATFALVPILLLAAALTAAAWPAWRAARLDPLECLR